MTTAAASAAASKNQHDDVSSEESLGSDDDDDLALDGELVRRLDSSDDDDDDNNNNSNKDDEEATAIVRGATAREDPPAKKAKVVVSKKMEKKRDDSDDSDYDDDDEDVPIDRVDVDFVFCDLDERFFHGVANFLSLQYKNNRALMSTVRPSLLADYLIQSNNSVGTCISTAADQGDVNDTSSRGNLYGYVSIALLSSTSSSLRNAAAADASVDNASSAFPAVPSDNDNNGKKEKLGLTNVSKKARRKQDEENDAPETALAALLDYVRSKVPSSQDTRVTMQYFETTMSTSSSSSSTTTKTTTTTHQHVGLLSHARMMNLPLELVPVLHQQLLLDLDYATGLQQQQLRDKSQIEEEEVVVEEDFDFRSLTHLIRVAPCDRDQRAGILYKFFDDEHLAEAAEAVFDISSNNNDNAGGGVDSSSTTLLRVILIPLEAYRQVVTDLARMFPSSA